MRMAGGPDEGTQGGVNTFVINQVSERGDTLTIFGKQ